MSNTDHENEMDDESENKDGIKITAEGVKIHISEKVSTGQYESATISQTVNCSVEGVDVTEGLTGELQARTHAIQKQLQSQVKKIAEERKPRDKPPVK